MDDESRIVKVVAASENAAIAAGDTTGYFALLAEDCVMLPPNASVKSGRELRDWLRTFIEEVHVVSLDYEHGETRIADNWAWHEYRCRWRAIPRAGGEAREICFKGLHVLRREGGDWKIVRNIWNTTPTDAP